MCHYVSYVCTVVVFNVAERVLVQSRSLYKWHTRAPTCVLPQFINALLLCCCRVLYWTPAAAVCIHPDSDGENSSANSAMYMLSMCLWAPAATPHTRHSGLRRLTRWPRFGTPSSTSHDSTTSSAAVAMSPHSHSHTATATATHTHSHVFEWAVRQRVRQCYATHASNRNTPGFRRRPCATCHGGSLGRLGCCRRCRHDPMSRSGQQRTSDRPSSVLCVSTCWGAPDGPRKLQQPRTVPQSCRCSWQATSRSATRVSIGRGSHASTARMASSIADRPSCVYAPIDGLIMHRHTEEAQRE